ncbi:MAG: DMT family transporter [Hyphomicrobiales bacterium]
MAQGESTQTDTPDVAGKLVSYALLIFMGLAWGLGVSLSKIGGETGAHPLGLAQWQVTVAALVTFFASIAFSSLPTPRRDVVRFGLVCGAVGIAFPAIAIYFAATHLPAGVVAIAYASMPLFTYAMSVVAGSESSDWRRLLGVIVGLVAMGFIILPKSALPDPSMVPWVLLAFGASVSMSFENFFAGAYRPAGVSSLALSFCRQFGAAVWLTPAAAVSGTFLPLLAPWGAMQWAATGAGLISGIAFTALLYVIKTSGAVFGSQASYLITLAGVGWGMILFGERHSAWVWLALVLTLVAVSLVRPQHDRPLD